MKNYKKTKPIGQHRATIMMLVGAMFIFFLVGTASAMDWDNKLTYENKDMKVVVKNWLGLGEKLGELTLTSHKTPTEIRNVIAGKNRAVMYYDFKGWKKYERGLGKVYFTDMKTGLKVDKDYYFAEAIYHDVEVPIYKEVCEDVYFLNSSSTKTFCSKEISGSKIESQFKEWKRLDTKDILNYDVRIALITDVNRNDYTDAVWTIAGKKISRHAEWQSSYSVGLTEYFKLNATTGDVIESVFGRDVINVGALRGREGIINNSFDFDGGDGKLINCSDKISNLGTEWSFGTWIKQLSPMGISNIFVCGISYLELYIHEGKFKIYDGAWRDSGYTFNLIDWNFLVVTQNTSGVSFFVNGTYISTIASNQRILGLTEVSIGGYPPTPTQSINAKLDEVGFWNRSLTHSEVSDLWNNGDGLTYILIDDENPQINITYPINNSENMNTTLYVEYIVSDDFEISSCWYSNGTYEVNTTLADCGNITGITWTEGIHNVTIWVNDTSNNVNQSQVIWTTVIPPELEIVYPTNNSNHSVNSVDVNYSVSDASLDSCWWSKNKGYENNSLVCGQNITDEIWSDGINNVTIWANDSLNNLAVDRVSFNVNTTPDIHFISPTPATYTNLSINSFVVNVSLTETYFYNLTFNLYNSSGLYDSTTFTDSTRHLNWSGVADGNYTYNATAWTTTSQSNTTATRIITIDTTHPILNITFPIDYIDFHLVNTNLTFNWTVSDTHLDSCWGSFDSGVNNISLTCADNNLSVSMTSHLNNTFSFYANDTYGNVNNDSVTWDYYIFENNQTYNNITIEGNLETFLANIYKSSNITISEVILVYNSTNYIGESFILGDATILRKQNLLIPSVSADINKTFYWDLTLSNGVRVNLTAYNQTTQNLGMDNCTTYTVRILNLTVVDEELQTLIPNATITTAVNLYSSDRSTLILNLSGVYNNPSGVCLNINLSSAISYSLDTIIKYEATGYAIEYYNIANFTLTNDSGTQNIILYDLNSSDSTEFQLTFTGADFLVVENALVYINRQYIAEDVFKTVELPKTDYNGQTILHMVKNDIIYNIIIIKDGIVLGTFNNIIAFCEDFTIGNCKIILTAFDTVEEVFDYNSELGITFNPPSFDDSTRIITFNFLSTDGTAKEVLMNVTRNDIFGNRTVCDDTLISAGGTLTCAVNPNIDESILKISIYVDGIDTAHSTVKLDSSNYGVAGYLIFFIMAISFILVFSESKTGVLISIVLAFVSAIGLNLISGDVIGLGASGLWLILIMVLAIWKLNKERIS